MSLCSTICRHLASGCAEAMKLLLILSLCLISLSQSLSLHDFLQKIDANIIRNENGNCILSFFFSIKMVSKL